MALKIDTNQSATAFHINDGAVLFPYAVDAQFAISHHPLEWSEKPWPPEAAAASREKLGLAAAAALSPEDQAALDAHNKTVAESAARLKAYQDKKSKEQAEADQAAQDELIIASVPPQPDPNARRPMTPAQLRKASAQLTPQEIADKKIADDKAEADHLAAASFGGAKLST